MSKLDYRRVKWQEKKMQYAREHTLDVPDGIVVTFQDNGMWRHGIDDIKKEVEKRIGKNSCNIGKFVEMRLRKQEEKILTSYKKNPHFVMQLLSKEEFKYAIKNKYYFSNKIFSIYCYRKLINLRKCLFEIGKSKEERFKQIYCAYLNQIIKEYLLKFKRNKNKFLNF